MQISSNVNPLAKMDALTAKEAKLLKEFKAQQATDKAVAQPAEKSQPELLGAVKA